MSKRDTYMRLLAVANAGGGLRRAEDLISDADKLFNRVMNTDLDDPVEDDQNATVIPGVTKSTGKSKAGQAA